MKLFYTSASPFARKARAALIEAGLEKAVETVEITQLTVPTNHIPELSRENPLGKVPALQLENGRRIVDSAVISEYFDSLGKGTLFPSDDMRWTALTLHALADGIIEAGIACRLEGLRPEAIRWQDWVDAHRRKLIAALDAVEADAEFLSVPFNIGQLTLACAVEWIAFRDVYHDSRVGRPRLASWLDKVQDRPSLVSTRP
jgi:glutathione S-transferase